MWWLIGVQTYLKGAAPVQFQLVLYRNAGTVLPDSSREAGNTGFI